ncbi:hypothetical protein C0989_006359 [Termitomyces sp. Mn162]|nr:hypothetical protein C0989_006359 [Termitomyces sp. Mn162]
MDDLTSNTAKHLVGALAVARGEGWSKGCEDNEVANCGDIQETGPLTPKAVASSIARGLATLPGLVTTPRSKGKGKGKARDEEDKDIEDQIEEMFTNKCLAALLHWRKASTVVDTGLEAGVKLEKAKGKVTVLLEKQQEYKCMQGADTDFDERVAGVERQFQRELEAAREELLAVRACYAVAKQTLATLAGYWRDCQAFLAWQEENNVGEGDWEEAEVMEVPDDNTDLDA